MESERKDVSAIQDEDVLRRMWQQSEDFGRKKEIRAHMYKLREARLKEFYTSGEVLKDVQRSNSSPGLREQHVEKNQKWVEGGVTHADSLADHSFLSLKSKEIRDSESPTRDVQFRNSKNRCDNDGTWTIASKTTKSNDGKTITNAQLATTQGSHPVDGGNKSYAALNQHESSVYTDGDANNFTKAVGESSKTFAQEQVVTGDENNFRTSKTVSSSSSSKFVSHSSSTTGNTNIDDSLIRGQLQIDDGRSGTTRTVHRQDNIQDHTSKIGRHQVEATSKTSVQESTSQNQEHSQRVQESKSSATNVTKRVQQSSDIITPIDGGKCTTIVTKTVHSSDLPEELKKQLIDGNTKVITETKTLPDGSTVTTTRYETKGSKKWSSTSGSTQVSSSSNRQVVDQKSSSTQVNTNNTQGKNVITTATKLIDYPDKAENIRIVNTESHDGGQIHITKHHEDTHVDQSKVTREDVRNITKQNVKDVKVTQDNANNQTVKVTKTITTSEDYLQPTVKHVPQSETNTTVHKTIKSDVDQAHVDKGQVHHQIDVVVTKQERPKEPMRPVLKPESPAKETPPKKEQGRPQEIEVTKSCKPQAEQYKPSEPTDGQYSTTYRSEFTPKRISVDISPTHDAFVRSLRCKSPDRLSDRPNSRGQSTTSLRSSTSPEKTTSHPSRKSPERKPSYDKRSPDKYTSEPARKHNTSPSRPEDYSPDNRHTKNYSSPDRVSKSPDRTYSRTSPEKITVTKVTDTITRKKSSPNVTTRKSPERPITSSSIRSVSPTKSGPSSPTRNTNVTITTKTTRVTKTTSPEKTSPIRGTSPNKYDRTSPACSPTKPKETTEITTFNSDTITRKKKQPEDGNKISKPIDLSNSTTKTDTITRRTSKSTVTEVDKSIVSENTISNENIKKPKRPSSRDASPTTSVSDFEFVFHTNQQMVTDLDEPEPKYPEKRPTSLDIDVTTTTVTTTKKTNVSPKQLSSPVKETPRQKSPTKSSPKASSPLKDKSSPIKEVPKRTSYQPSAPELEPDEEPPSVFPVEDQIILTQVEPTCERPKSKEPKEKPPLKRTETYEERCRKILGLPETEKPSTKKEMVPDEYAGRTPVEEPVFVKKHIDYGHPEDDIIKKTTDKIKSRKAEKKEPVDVSEFITTERNIESDIIPVEDTLPKVEEPKLFSSPTRKSPEKQKPKGKKPVGEYTTEYTDECIDKPITRKDVIEITITPKHDKPVDKEFSPQQNIDDLPGYMRPIPKISSEERDKIILENRQREISPDKQPKTTPEGEYITEYTDEYIEKSGQERITKSKGTENTSQIDITSITADKIPEKKSTRKSPERSPTQKQPQKKQHPDERDFNTEYTDEYCEEKEIRYSPQKPSNKSQIITDTEKISKIYKQIETPVRAKSPTKKPDKNKPKNVKPSEPESSYSEDESIEVDEYYKTEIKTDIKTRDKKIHRKSPSPVRRKPDLERKSPEKDRESPSRSLPENVTVTEYINEYCDTAKESELFDTSRKTITVPATDFISKEKHDTDITLEITTQNVSEKEPIRKSPSKQLQDIEFEFEIENEQLAKIRTHRIDTTVVTNGTQSTDASPKRRPQKALPSDTMECTSKKTTTKKEEETVIANGHPSPQKDKPNKKPQKPSSPDDRSKSPTKQIKDIKKDSSKIITKKTSTDFIETTKRRTTDETLKKKSPADKSPERRSPSPTTRTNERKVIETRNIEQITRKCSKKDIPIRNIPDSKDKHPTKPIIFKTPESPVRKQVQQSPTKQISKPSQPKPAETPKKHVVTKTISLTSRSDTKSQPTSPIKEFKPLTTSKASPKTITTIKTTKITHPATITVTKATTKTMKQKSKDVESSDSESELGVEDLRAEINNKISRTNIKKIITTAKINVISPKYPTSSSPQGKSKQPNVTMPTIKVNTDEIITDNHLHKPITILIDTNNEHESITITMDNNQTTSSVNNQPAGRVTSDKPSNIKKLTTKCLSTKSIVLNNSADDITVDLQRSTSSREPSPDKICPVPVSSDDEYGHPRYPDQVSEPDDRPSKKKPQKITDIPLTEGEDVKHFNRITEVTETVTTTKSSPRITDIDKVTETDESLLSVTEKVSKFITTAEKLTDDEIKTKKPAPKVPRPELVFTEDLKEDECLLSVSDKVSKFINTTEQVSTKKPDKPQTFVRKPTNDFKVEENDECLKSVNEKVNRFIHAAETSKKVKTSQKVTRPEITDLDEDLRADECLLSVSDKVSKFLTTADKLTTETNKTKTETFINKEREQSPDKPDTNKYKPEIQREKSPEKKPDANKYKPETKREKSPEKKPDANKYKPEIKREKSPEKKPETPSLIHSPSRKSPERKLPEKDIKICPEPARRSTEPVPDSTYQSSRPKSEPVQPLKSSEAVKKAKAMFENISKTQEVPRQRDILSRPSIWEARKKPEQKPVDDADVKLTDIGVYKKPETTKTTEVRKQLNYNQKEDVTLKSTKLILNEKKFDTSRSKSKSPERETPQYLKPKTCTTVKDDITIETNTYRRTKSPERDEDLPGYMRSIPKVSPEERDHLIIESRLRESITPDRDTYRRTVIEQDESTTEVFRTKQPVENGDIPGYMRPLQRCLSPEREHKKSIREEEEIIVETTLPIRSYSPPEKDVPGYMKPLQRKMSPDRDGSKFRDTTDTPREYSPVPDDTPRSAKKFGVTLRRTDSGRMVPTERRRSSTPGQPVIEDIQDLEVLEKMMDTVVGYEQRRRIRAQIRVVKRLISENKITTFKRTTKPASFPARDSTGSKSAPLDDRRSPAKKLPSDNKTKQIKETEYRSSNQSSLIRERSKSPVTITKKRPSFETYKITSDRKTSDQTYTRERSISPETKRRTCLFQTEKDFKTESSFKSSSYTSCSRSEQKIESRQSSKERSMSPDIRRTTPITTTTTTTKKIHETDLRRAQPASKITPVQDDKPSWITNRNLKKATDSVTERKTVTTSSKKKETPKRAYSPQKETKPTDCITSSYGIGPTDENGLPLFGIRALRKAADNVHVRGTVVTSEFYSENGNEPVGEVSVTKYSTNPKELDIHDTKKKGFTSVTTTQKFGTRGAPTLKTLTDKKKAITDKHSEEDEIIKTTSTKVTRRGSVKALSQKFIENAVETTSKEKQTCYPKAGLILRTSSFKDSTQSSAERSRELKSSSRESSPGYETRPTKISLESITSDSRNFSTTSAENTKTFLNSHTRVTSAQDVLSRMKNAEKEQVEGDSVEDREARMLLNKFLGAQVLMSGMEPLLGTGSSTQSAVSSSAQLVRKVQKTKTSSSSSASSSNKTKDSSKQVAVKQRFQCPITPEVLQDIWDEQTLRALLEQCTDYEERRAIRARLRQVMAEQEAVANVISSAVSERDSSDNRHSVHERFETKKSTFSEGPITTTQEVSTRVISSRQQVTKPMSPFAKFRQLDKQNSLNTPPSSPRTPTGSSGAPLFKFTDPALSHSASTVKDRLLYWCQMKTKEYENVKLDNFSTSWADGLAFCALIHHFLPDSFDYHALTPQQRRHNFTLAFKVADEQAGIYPLLDVDDMVAMRRPDWKCVFTYVQAIYRRFKDEEI